MRAYFFGNLYLSSIQQGIQAGHCIADMFVRYDDQITPGPQNNMLFEWAKNYKTMILLNGGYDSTIRDLTQFFEDLQNPYPWVDFFESDEAMNGMQTTVGIVLPERIYEAAAMVRKCRGGWDELTQYLHNDGTRTIFQPSDAPVAPARYWEYSAWEIELIDRLNSFNLAR